MKKVPKFNIFHSGNNQITFARAQDEFGITEADVAHLSPKVMRSPYEDGESIKVYLEDDILKIINEKEKNQFQKLASGMKKQWFEIVIPN